MRPIDFIVLPVIKFFKWLCAHLFAHINVFLCLLRISGIYIIPCSLFCFQQHAAFFFRISYFPFMSSGSVCSCWKEYLLDSVLPFSYESVRVIISNFQQCWGSLVIFLPLDISWYLFLVHVTGLTEQCSRCHNVIVAVLLNLCRECGNGKVKKV
jgi:hypothetical protein